VTGPGGYESGDTAPPPGWYPDPDGARGQVRWWNGVSWSDVMTPAGPGVAVQHSPVLAPTSVSSSGVIAPPEPPPGTGRRGGAGWVIGLAIVALVAVFGVVLFVNRDEGSGETPTAEETPPSSSFSEPAPPTFDPGTVRIFDDEAGLSYPYLGDGWYEWNLTGQIETTNTAGQYFVTQEVTPDQTTFIAQCTSGALGEGYGWSGPASLESTLAAVADNVRGNYYPGPNEREVLRDEARTVDGHEAWLYEFQLSWDVAGYEATGERAALLLVDVGRPAPALMYISIPNTHAELYGVIDVVLDGVEVI
jgi:hypothetical protein